MSSLRFQDRVSLVTGASSGIGRASAVALAREGARVVLVARRTDRLAETVREIERGGGYAAALPCDLTQERDLNRAVDEAAAMWGRLDVVVQAAGIIGFGTVETTSLPAWREMFEINVVSVFLLTQRVVPHLEAGQGNVVVVSSVTGLRSFPGVLAYCASKAATDQLVRCAALELAPKGIRINAVNPGVVLSELHRAAGLDAVAYDAFLERSKTTHPLGRVGRPEEVADLILFLASGEASWITGATVSIDGGRALTCAR
jgi:NAD(P)-dependent dehydrogenase (short-subunit alcohol dehydrogenase family)